MIIINISEWIINILLIGIALVLWGMGLLIISMLISIIIEKINKKRRDK
jgi:hypothetical protein